MSMSFTNQSGFVRTYNNIYKYNYVRKLYIERLKSNGGPHNVIHFSHVVHSSHAPREWLHGETRPTDM